MVIKKFDDKKFMQIEKMFRRDSRFKNTKSYTNIVGDFIYNAYRLEDTDLIFQHTVQLKTILDTVNLVIVLDGCTIYKQLVKVNKGRIISSVIHVEPEHEKMVQLIDKLITKRYIDMTDVTEKKKSKNYNRHIELLDNMTS